MAKLTMYIVLNSSGKQIGVRHGNSKSANDFKKSLEKLGKTGLSIKPIEVNN